MRSEGVKGWGVQNKGEGVREWGCEGGVKGEE